MDNPLDNILRDIENDIEILCPEGDTHKAETAERLKSRVALITGMLRAVGETYRTHVQAIAEQYGIAETPATTPPDRSDRSFTPERLATFNGKNGMPAYVAVAGVVYDVTNDPLWAGGTHFTMTPGRDLTLEYSNCHEGRPRLVRLPVVGTMVIQVDKKGDESAESAKNSK